MISLTTHFVKLWAGGWPNPQPQSYAKYRPRGPASETLDSTIPPRSTDKTPIYPGELSFFATCEARALQ